ncbi:GntR family transcriptional regulator [Nocardioides panacihumi]|uniref:GntR family transcriptional regulator n=1 Tax=Nocardioides panacihumi TaxID=400774 RepID=A0ABN2QN34_9ACTN
MPTGRVTRHPAPLRHQVARLLREDILDGVYAPGERLLETRMCESYGVSRTVVREALRQLETERLVTVLAHRGPIVTVLSAADIKAVYDVRRALEGLAGELFARDATPEQADALLAHLADMEVSYVRGTVKTREQAKERFYELLLAGTGNDVLAADLSTVHARIALFRRYALVDDERVHLSFEELREIVTAAAVTRDPEDARRRCEHHIAIAGRLAVEEYERRLDAEPAHASAT